MNRSSSELKRLAREKLDGNYAFSIGALILSDLIIVIFSIAINNYTSLNTMLGRIIYYLINFLFGILSNVFMLGLTKIFLNICRKQKHSLNDLIYCFTHQVDRFIIVAFFLTLPSFLISKIGNEFIMHFQYSFDNIFVYPMISSGYSLFSSFISMIIILGLFPAAFLLLDNPELSGMEAIKKSLQIMKGHKGRLLYLNVSFWGLRVLSIFTCGIGLLWIMPYMYCSQCFFYLNLIGELDRAPEESMQDSTIPNNVNNF